MPCTLAKKDKVWAMLKTDFHNVIKVAKVAIMKKGVYIYTYIIKIMYRKSV